MRRREEQGQTLVIGAVCMVALLGFLALVADGGNLFVERRNLQGTADAAAMAAVRELPGSPGTATATASDYAQNLNGDDIDLQGVEFANSNSQVRVTVRKTVPGSFLAVIGKEPPTVRARATARASQLRGIGGALPFALLRDSYTMNTQKQVRDVPGDKAGLVYPEVEEDNCALANGGNDDRLLIRGPYADGGIISCPTAVGKIITTNSGWKNGNVKGGFDDRIGTNRDSFEDLTDWDPSTGKFAITNPNSPRIGVVPIVENVNGATDWVHNTNIRILGYTFVYIGKRDDPPSYPAYTNNGKDVWLTPIDSVMPVDYNQDYEFADTWTNGAVTPVAYRLVE